MMNLNIVNAFVRGNGIKQTENYDPQTGEPIEVLPLPDIDNRGTSIYSEFGLADADGGRLSKLAAGTLGNGLPAAKLRLERLRRGN